MNNNPLKLLWIVFFVAFAAVSCWATAESLHLLLPNLWKGFVWIATIGCFILASLGTKLIVDSLNQNIYQEKRGLKLLGGIMLCIAFWLVFSMPTNTHTFFYRSTIGDIVTQDISTTKGYLGQLKSNTKIENAIKNAQASYETTVDAAFNALCAEIMNTNNPGFGDASRARLQELSNALGGDAVPELTGSWGTQKQRKALCDDYQNLVNMRKEQGKNDIANKMRRTQQDQYVSESNKNLSMLEEIEKAVTRMNTGNLSYDAGETDENVIQQADAVLALSYGTINTFNEFVVFDINGDDKEVYLASPVVTRTHKMLSVVDVWKDFIGGKYKGYGLIYWVIVSILVDIAAFIFFDLAFKKSY